MRLNPTDRSTFTSLQESGRLEIFINGRWGTVCDNGFTMTSAQVACEQLGFSRAVRWTSIGAQK